MAGLTLKVTTQDVKKVEADALVVGFFEDVRPLKGLAGELDWLLCGALSRLLIEKRLKGAIGDVALLTSQGKLPAAKIFLVGLGPCSGFSVPLLRSAARTAAVSATGAGISRAAMEFLQPQDASYDDSLPAIRDGLAEGSGGRSLSVSLLARDTAAYDRLTRLLASSPKAGA